ncbi:hypothetical protein TRIUR3_14648 [Triticum urartu]|uniref:Uncharacterized protein n=1 Tax=Triticum urartu TaxID=4572 RepID=M7YYQ0_TRIUA|nr:hypothetical protein TRIUR3_14648 [Triticum urartu]
MDMNTRGDQGGEKGRWRGTHPWQFMGKYGVKQRGRHGEAFDPGNKWFCPGFADRTITKRLRVGYGDANIALGANRFKFRLMSMRIGSLLNHQNKSAHVATHGQWEKCDVHLGESRKKEKKSASRVKKVVADAARCNARASHHATWNVFAYFVFHFMLWWNDKELVKPVCTNGYELRKQFLLYLLKRRGNEAKENFSDIVKEFLKRII